MVLLINIVCALIFSLICLFPNGVAEKDSRMDMCLKKLCQQASNPFDITRNDADAENGPRDSNSYETNPGDMFRDISANPDIKKVSEVHDNGFYTSLCWIEITTITETNNGSKSAIREYAITFETPSDIPEKYISKKSDRINGETVKYKIFDRDTKKSEVVNFTTVSKSKESTVRQNRKILCGSGPIYTKEFVEWRHSDRKRVEIRVSPKRQNLVASDCIVLNANVENISTLSPTRRDNTSLTEEGIEGRRTLKYSTKITPKDIENESIASNKITENTQTDQYVETTETTIERIFPSPSTLKTLPYESSTEPKVENQKLNLDTFTPSKTLSSITKLPNQPLRIKESTPHTSVTNFQENVIIEKDTTEIINKDADSTVIIGSQTTNIEDQTKPYIDLHSTKLLPNVEDTLANKDATELLEYSAVTEILKNREPTEIFNTVPREITSSTVSSDKNRNIEIEDSKLKSTSEVIKVSNEYPFNPDLTPNQVAEGNGSTTYTTVVEQYDKHISTEDWVLSTTSQEPPQEPQKSTLVQVKVQHVLNTERNVVKEEDTRVPPISTEIYDVSYAPIGINPITTENSVITTDKATVKTTTINLETKTGLLTDATFNTLATEPAMKRYTEILKNVDKNTLKENDDEDESMKTNLISSTTEKIGTSSMYDIKESTTQYGEKIKSYPSKVISVTLPSSTSFSSRSNAATDIVSPSKNNNSVGSSTTSQSYVNEDLDKVIHTTIIGVPDSHYSPIDKNFTDDILENSSDNTTNYNIVEHEEIMETVSTPLYNRSFSSSKGLSDQIQYVTKNVETLKTAPSQVKASQKPIENNTVNDKITSLNHPKYTTINDLQQGSTVAFSHLPQKYNTVPGSMPDQKENTIKSLEVSKPGHAATLTELPFTLSLELSNKSHTSDTASTDVPISPQPVTIIEIFPSLPDNYSTETLLDQEQVKNSFSETPAKQVHQSKGITEQPSKLRDFTDPLSNLSPKETTESTTASENILDETQDAKTTSNIPQSVVTGVDFQSFYDYGPTSSDINSESLIHESRTTTQTASKSTAESIVGSSNAVGGTYTQEISLKIPLNSKTVLPATDSVVNSSLYDFQSTTESEQNTQYVNTHFIGRVSTPKNLEHKTPETLLNEMSTIKSDFEIPNHQRIKSTVPKETVHPTDTYFTTLVTVSGTQPKQFQSTTTIGENSLNETSKESITKPTNDKTKISSVPISDYVSDPESTTDANSFTKHTSFKLEENRNSVNSYSSKIPVTDEYYTSLKPKEKTYSNVPYTYSNDAYITSGTTSTNKLFDKSGRTTATFKYPNEFISGEETGSTTATKLFLDQDQGTTKDIDLGPYSEEPLEYSHHTTSTEGLTSEKLLDKYQYPSTNVASDQQADSELPVKYPTSMSSIEDFTSSENLVDVSHRHTEVKQTSSTRGYTSSERLLDQYQTTIKDKFLKQKLSSELLTKYPSDTSPTALFSSSDRLLGLYQVTTTDRIKPGRQAYSNNTSSTVSTDTSQRSQHRPKFYTNNPEFSTSLEDLSEQFQSTAEQTNLAKKPHSEVHHYPNDMTTNYFNKDFTSPELLEKFQSTTETINEEDLGHTSDAYYSTRDLALSTTLLIQPQNLTKPKLREKYFTSGFTTTSSSLNYPQTTITKTIPLSPVSIPYVENTKNRPIPLDKSEKFKDAEKNVPNYTRTNSIPVSTETSTANTVGHILKGLDKSLCNNTKQKISVKVKILMEHILEENEDGTIRKDVVPIMGVEKKTEFDIKPKQLYPVVPHKKLNEDWNLFLDDLAKNFFDFNRHAVQDYTKLEPKNLNLNVPGYEFAGDILLPRESIRRMQGIRNAFRRCKNKQGNQVFRGPKPIYQLPANKKRIAFRNKHAIDDGDDVNQASNLELTTKSEDNLTSDFYRFLLSSPASDAQLDIDNKPMKVDIPTKLMLPLNERSKMKAVEALNEWKSRPDAVLGKIEYISPIPGTRRLGYKQFSLSDLFPILSKSEGSQYIPTLIYHTVPKIVPDIFPPYSSLKNYDMYNVLPSQDSQPSIDLAPRIEDYRINAIRNSQYATSIASSITTDGVDFETATVKSFNHKQKINNDTLKKTKIKQTNATDIVHPNEENLNSTLRKLSNNGTEETNIFSSRTSENSNLNVLGRQESEKVNLNNPISENLQSEHSKNYNILYFKGVLNGIIIKLSALLEKLSKR